MHLSPLEVRTLEFTPATIAFMLERKWIRRRKNGSLYFHHPRSNRYGRKREWNLELRPIPPGRQDSTSKR